ncbi:hypothetical protein [Aeoliella sp.]|uniref:hypothetical protein n=1 Tax=Aeoliella sp. TaxID=2795800 RepID=UPI003CCC3FF8
MFRTVVLSVAVLGLVLGSEAFAQRDAGAKARREFGKGFWNSQSRARVTRSTPIRVVSPVQASNQANTALAAESYRSFSYEPAPEVTKEETPQAAAPATKAETQSPCQATPSVTYRSFSYEPGANVSPRYEVRRSSAPRHVTPPQVRLHPGTRSY